MKLQKNALTSIIDLKSNWAEKIRRVTKRELTSTKYSR